VGPFEFIILFFSFIYTLALTHLLFAVTRMIRHRRVVVFSWPHALWMLDALLLVSVNWISFWDVHRFETMPIGFIATGFLLVIMQYLICALVAPDFEDGDTFDLRLFHEREGRTYMLAFLAIMLVALAVNAAAGMAAGMQNWANQNAFVLAMAPTVLLPLIVRARWAQVLGPLVLAVLIIGFLGFYYPALTRT
jgi:hypothetical protein